MDTNWKIKLTLERVGTQYRASLLTYRDLPHSREEKAHLFMAGSREEALNVAREAAGGLGISKFAVIDRTNEHLQRAKEKGEPTMKLERRMLYILLHIDTNLINAKQKLAAVNQLEKWAADEVILMNMSGTAHAEARADGHPLRTRKANQQIFTATPVARDELYYKIADALFPQGLINQNQENDVSIVHEAAKYQAILVTSDGASKSQPGGILGNRDKLHGLVKILSPEEVVEFVRNKIRERDEFNARVAQQIGADLPEWTGKD